MKELRFAILGTGYWARYQLAAWRELEGVRCVALYNRTRAKAEALAAEFDVPSVYEDADKLLREEDLDFADVITDVSVHRKLVEQAAKANVPVICQKPLAENLADAGPWWRPAINLVFLYMFTKTGAGKHRCVN